MSTTSLPIPLLILSDAITGSSGLGRIARDLATRIHSSLSDTYRVATLGIGGGALGTSFRFGFPNYPVRSLDTSYAHTPLGLIPNDLPAVWLDFAGVVGDGLQEDDEQELVTRKGQMRKGIILAIQNVSWVGWLGQPSWLPEGHALRHFLGAAPTNPIITRPILTSEHLEKFSPAMQRLLTATRESDDSNDKVPECPVQRWLYCPVDGHCPDGTLGADVAPILEGFDRLLGYTRYGAEVMERTLSKWTTPKSIDYPEHHVSKLIPPPAIPNLPHGLDTSVFFPRPRYLARERFFRRLSRGASDFPLEPDTILLCVNATNTPRKDWGLAFETCAALLSRNQNVFLWGHTDKLEGHWSLPSLARQFGMAERVTLTVDRYSDEDLAWFYSACDCMLGIGSGEGWGLCLSEALACSLPVVHGDYAGGAEFTYWKPKPQSYRIEGRWNIQRPTYSPDQWALYVEDAIALENKHKTKLPEYIRWDKAWPAWESWLRAGVAAKEEPTS